MHYSLPTPLEQAQRHHARREYSNAAIKRAWHQYDTNTLKVAYDCDTLWEHTYHNVWLAIRYVLEHGGQPKWPKLKAETNPCHWPDCGCTCYEDCTEEKKVQEL